MSRKYEAVAALEHDLSADTARLRLKVHDLDGRRVKTYRAVVGADSLEKAGLALLAETYHMSSDVAGLATVFADITEQVALLVGA